MKRILSLSVLYLALLTGCTGSLEERIADLDKQVSELEVQLQKQNKTIASLQGLLAAYSTRDFITGITQLDGNAGYVVHFSRLEDIVIYHGSDARVPRVGIKRNPSDGKYYWTIQYGSSEAQYIINDTGNMIPAVGEVPLLKIENGDFYISYDSQKTWQYLGRADGTNGDDIFEKIISTDDYVTFVTAEEEFKIPTYKLVQSLNQQSSDINTNLSSLSRLINDLAASAVCVTSVTDNVVGGQVIGSIITLSSGYKLVIDDWVNKNAPGISAEKDETDSRYYWSVLHSDGTREWLLDADGNRMAASGESVEIPVVVPVLDEKENVYYWSVVAAGDTTYVRDTNGNRVVATSKAGEFKVFSKVDNSNRDYLVLTLANGGTVRVPKIYTIEFSEAALTLPAGGSKSVSFKIYGADKSMQFSVVTQGDLTASVWISTSDPGSGSLSIQAGAGFAGNGKVMLVVSAANGSVKTMYKTIDVSLEE